MYGNFKICISVPLKLNLLCFSVSFDSVKYEWNLIIFCQNRKHRVWLQSKALERSVRTVANFPIKSLIFATFSSYIADNSVRYNLCENRIENIVKTCIHLIMHVSFINFGWIRKYTYWSIIVFGSWFISFINWYHLQYFETFWKGAVIKAFVKIFSNDCYKHIRNSIMSFIGISFDYEAFLGFSFAIS